jgi:hypothetical protein
MIYLEPRRIYDAAIVGQENNLIVYCYYLIVEALEEEGWSMEQACEHINYNIMGTFMDGWPTILT